MMSFENFEHGKVNIDGALLHYRRAGSGDVVILLHGWPQHSLQWHAVAPILAQKYTVIAPDLPGCGSSMIPSSGRYDKKTLAFTMKILMDQLCDGPVRVVGYDHGAGVAYNIASMFPDLVKQLAIIEYVLPGLGYEKAMLPSPTWHTGSNWHLGLFTVPDVAEFAFRGRERELLNWFFWHGAFKSSPVSQLHLAEYVDHITKPGALRAGIALYASVWQDMADNLESLKQKLKMPVLAIGGASNAGALVGNSLSTAADHLRSSVIAKSGHWICDENPEELTAVLMDFFDAVPIS